MLLPYLYIVIIAFLFTQPVAYSFRMIFKLGGPCSKADKFLGLFAILSILGLLAWREFHPLLDKPIDLYELSYTFITISAIVGISLSVLWHISVISILDRTSSKNKRDEVQDNLTIQEQNNA